MLLDWEQVNADNIAIAPTMYTTNVTLQEEKNGVNKYVYLFVPENYPLEQPSDKFVFKYSM